jgi:hypothetical protein|tara:strand:- start:661 stop:921 length:261 start_codon:yes stop_codon:yes gene_type:complete
MEGDPTGGLWIYLIFLIIPLARIIPRLLRKYRNNDRSQQNESYSQEKFFTNERMPEPPRFREELPEPEPQPKPDKKDGWVGKDDFK